MEVQHNNIIDVSGKGITDDNESVPANNEI